VNVQVAHIFQQFGVQLEQVFNEAMQQLEKGADAIHKVGNIHQQTDIDGRTTIQQAAAQPAAQQAALPPMAHHHHHHRHSHPAHDAAAPSGSGGAAAASGGGHGHGAAHGPQPLQPYQAPTLSPAESTAESGPSGDIAGAPVEVQAHQSSAPMVYGSGMAMAAGRDAQRRDRRTTTDRDGRLIENPAGDDATTEDRPAETATGREARPDVAARPAATVASARTAPPPPIPPVATGRPTDDTPLPPPADAPAAG
jgi:hypothetical protein